LKDVIVMIPQPASAKAEAQPSWLSCFSALTGSTSNRASRRPLKGLGDPVRHICNILKAAAAEGAAEEPAGRAVGD
jgi:hypothetical protein